MPTMADMPPQISEDVWREYIHGQLMEKVKGVPGVQSAAEIKEVKTQVVDQFGDLAAAPKNLGEALVLVEKTNIAAARADGAYGLTPNAPRRGAFPFAR